MRRALSIWWFNRRNDHCASQGRHGGMEDQCSRADACWCNAFWRALAQVKEQGR